jgi:hypothetical protein
LKTIVFVVGIGLVNLIFTVPLFLPLATKARSGGNQVRAPAPGLMSPLLVVCVIFLLDAFVLWILSKISKGKPDSTVKAVIERFGGNIWITAAGLVGSFLAIAFVGIGGVYLLSH